MVPILEGAGLEVADGAIVDWLNALFAGVPGAADGLPSQPLRPDEDLTERFAELVPEDADSSFLLADSRNLLLLDFWAGQFPDARFLLFYRRAEAALAHALAQDLDAVRFVDAWKSDNRLLLRFQRRHRGRSVLLDADAAVIYPEELIQAARQGGVHLVEPPECPESPAGVPVLERLLASRLVAGEAALEALQAELDASAMPLGAGAYPPPMLAAELLEDYLAWKARERQQVQAELEAMRLEVQANAAAREELGAQRQGLEAQLAHALHTIQAAEASQREVAHENELLLVHLGQLQEEVEHYSARYRESLSRIAGSDREVTDLNRRIAGIHGSIVWKVAAPLRALTSNRKESAARARAALRRQIKLIQHSALFDRQWYVSEYGDVRRSGVDPIKHYLSFGAAEGRNPSPAFDTRFYLETYPDVAESGLNPLLHYIKFGRDEGRKPSRSGASS